MEYFVPYILFVVVRHKCNRSNYDQKFCEGNLMLFLAYFQVFGYFSTE